MPEHKSTVDSLEISSLAPTRPPDYRFELLLTENPTNLSKSSRPETKGTLSDLKNYPSVYIIACTLSSSSYFLTLHGFNFEEQSRLLPQMTLNSAEKPPSDLQIKPSIYRGFEVGELVYFRVFKNQSLCPLAGGKFGGIRMELVSCQPELDRELSHRCSFGVCPVV
ncbi:hypothetical protein COLO4_28364 [Corchorus olitorius]|uniref:Uncharacterized protein n=1 Tax=Corchorus olitorius TaxID=93759 RepID=A0A1R3HLL0_9ROSI|nr:hypothetical protein COLO4_28364 [Corchorus olitorius]